MRKVIVTGGSRGIGFAIARRLIDEGYGVIVIARNSTNELEAAMEKANSAVPDSFRFISFDLTNVEQIPELIKRLHREAGPIYGLVNNAGISFEGVLSSVTDTHIHQLIQVNTLSPILVTKYIVKCMMADGGGRIVNIASVIASTGYSGLSVYGATKAAIVGFTRSLAREVGRAGITVNAVAPGFISTDLTRNMKDEQREKVERRSALRRLAEVDDVANMVEYLLSDKAKNITGTVFTVDAGNTA